MRLIILLDALRSLPLSSQANPAMPSRGESPSPWDWEEGFRKSPCGGYSKPSQGGNLARVR